MGRPPGRCLRRAPAAAAAASPALPARTGGLGVGGGRGAADGPWPLGSPPGWREGPTLSALPSAEQTAPGGRADGLRPSPGSPNVPDAWQARDAPGPLWLPYVFNKIRQIGPGDRDCSKAVIKQRKPGQCKRQQGPSWKGRWVPAPHRAARPGVSGSPQRCPRRFLSRSW